jgi:hypothetical protein
MGDIPYPNLPDAGAVNYNAGDIDYIIATDAVYYVNTNRPTRNLAYRDNVLESKLDTVIDWLNAARGTMPDLDSRLDVSINEDGTLKTAPDVAALEQTSAANLDARALLLRSVCPSGFLPPHSDGTTDGIIGGVVENVLSIYPGGAQDSVARQAHPSNAIFVRSLATLESGDANRLYLINQPMKVNVNGYEITLESRSTKYANTVITLPAVPSGSGNARQDMVVIEAWKEEVEVGAADDCFFPFGNVQYMDSTVTMNGQAFTLSNTDHSGGNWPLYLATAAEHGYYVVANDANIGKFIADPRNNVGVTPAGKFFQVRYRVSVLSGANPIGANNGTVFTALQDTSSNNFRPQGQKATRPAPGASDATGVLFLASLIANSAPDGMFSDPGMYLGAVQTGSYPTAVSGLSFDGFSYVIPVCIVHRRNSTAYAISNANGAATIGGTSGRPDGLFYNQVAQRDVLDLRHRVSANGWQDYEALYNETLQKYLSCDLTTNWEQVREDSDGNLSFADLNIYGTLNLRAEGVKASGFDSSYDVVRRATCNNGIVADPDGLRNYYSDQAGEQVIYGRIPNVGVDGALPVPMFAYVSGTHILTMDAQDFAANDGVDPLRPQWSGRFPDLYWMDAPNWPSQVGTGNKVWGAFSGASGDTISFTIARETYLYTELTAPAVLGNGDIYAAPNAVQVTFNGKYRGNNTSYSGYFTGATVPNVGLWTKIAGVGPANFTVASIEPGYCWIGFPSPSLPIEYVGEGYDLHAGKGISINGYVLWKAGSGFLSRVPYDNGDVYDGLNSIKRTEFRINGTQVLPDSGNNFHPFGSNFDPNISNGSGDPDSHTKSTNLIGFIHRGALGTLNAGGDAYGACVIKDGSIYKMWYHVAGVGIRYATSTDGLTWTSDQLVIPINSLPGSDTNGASNPHVIKDGATYKMWYSGFVTAGSVYKIIYCASADGITWGSFTATNVIKSFQGTYDTDVVQASCVIKDGATYRMWYNGNYGGTGVLAAVIYCDSADGLTWANATLCLQGGAEGSYDIGTVRGFGSPCVIKDNAVYKMWMTMTGSSTGRKLSYAFSTDGKNWSRPRVLMSSPIEGYYDNYYIAPLGVSVIKDDKTYKFWAGVYSPATGYKTLHGVFSMIDTANSGSSLVGVYSTTGHDNFAPGMLDDVLVYYESRALQADFSRLMGTTPNMSISYLLRYAPMNKAILTTLGTGGRPETTGYPLKYRDFIHQLTAGSWWLIGDMLSCSGMGVSRPATHSNSDEQYIEGIPVSFGHFWYYVGDIDRVGKSGDLISLSGLELSLDIVGMPNSLYDLSYQSILGLGCISTPVVDVVGASRVSGMLGAIVEYWKELVFGVSEFGLHTSYSTSGFPSESGYMQFLNMCGRPLMK